jgi:hypothetical protein
MKRYVNWPVGIVVSYCLFAGGTTAVVVYALNRPVDLVSPDYYAQSLQENRQMDAERNAAALQGAASIVQSGDRTVVVSLPPGQAAAARGLVTLYRPSDASADRVLALTTDQDGQQRISLDGLLPGAWSVRVRWAAQGREFYLEQRVVAR